MNSLDALALRAGIEDMYRDANGELRETPPDTKRALLTAMGFQAGTEEDLRGALALFDEWEWLRSFPPVIVAYASREVIELNAVLPPETSRLHWKVELESGEHLSGTADCGAETRLDRREIGGRMLERHSIRLNARFPQGYHLLRCDLDDSVCSLIVTPGRCWLPQAAESGDRLWGIAVQLYLLRSESNWGIGDFTDLRKLAQLVSRLGGDVVGLNPLHAMFLDNPEHASPYSPENRLLLNVLNIDVEAIPELADSPETRELLASEPFQERLAKCRTASLVDYAGVAELKLQGLKLLFKCCRIKPETDRWQQFESFRKTAGAAFEQSCVFEALRQHFAGITGKLASWRSWPPDFQDPSSASVERFAAEHSGAVNFYAWLQWLADEQLGAAAMAARKMQVGLYRDLAVGTDSTGAATWSNPNAVVSGASAGAPPDVFNPAGQDWGLPPLHPHFLYDTGYQSFIDLIRTNMRHAGGLRIDHVMALQHLYWVPSGWSPRDGAYVRYPLDDLIGIIALESHRNRCLVVGEDLGTVPEGFRERMAAACILSYRVLFFEQDPATGAFLPPAGYPRLALAVAGSHDLPTIRGWWEGIDISLKERLGLFPHPGDVSEAHTRRDRDRRELLQALQSEGLLDRDGTVSVEEVTEAVHAYLARTDALIAMVQVDDITAETDPVNVPATSEEHPNWRRRLSLTLEDLASHPRLERLTRAVADERAAAGTVRR